MAFNFDECIDRRHSDSYKWQKYAGRDVIPLWVADTDFRSPPCILEALRARVDHGIFGYGAPPTALSEIFIERMRERYQWDVKAEWLLFLPGLVSGLHLAFRAAVHSAWRWCVDFAAADPALSGDKLLLMLCNPHNPGGTSYRREELMQHLAFAQTHDLLVCSDEIHCDLLLTPGLRHIPFASLNEDAAQHYPYFAFKRASISPA
ncbi:Cystathionine beta-lyase PatB [Sodalis glossinidius str. 'morsitans']|uniref:cysteine-S-conjugate beta-lyase n=1 Tax=Sodalis glossinidius (strain morsitans) TaxID=343509 RepID=Q2NTK0_SODGM|nr:putative aminotransferase [Sodalis glossinidius str. 'morsitans']CRL45243.1 Cystathionine beta-lyase PatB [Sodalis glossinidius str. 'morsitans']